jgi:hypothetical protein
VWPPQVSQASPHKYDVALGWAGAGGGCGSLWVVSLCVELWPFHWPCVRVSCVSHCPRVTESMLLDSVTSACYDALITVATSHACADVLTWHR